MEWAVGMVTTRTRSSWGLGFMAMTLAKGHVVILHSNKIITLRCPPFEALFQGVEVVRRPLPPELLLLLLE